MTVYLAATEKFPSPHAFHTAYDLTLTDIAFSLNHRLTIARGNTDYARQVVEMPQIEVDINGRISFGANDYRRLERPERPVTLYLSDLNNMAIPHGLEVRLER